MKQLNLSTVESGTLGFCDVLLSNVTQPVLAWGGALLIG